MGELYDIFSGELLEDSPQDTVFAKNCATYICQELYDLGVANEFVAITGKHVQDLQVVVSPVGTDGRSRLDLFKVNNQFRRFAVVNYGDLMRKAQRVEEASMVDTCTMTQEDCLPFALHWIFYELAADALSNSVYMQSKVDKYIADFNGQSPYWRTELTIAELFLREYAQEDYSQYEVSFESLAFRAGFAAGLLKQKLLIDEQTRSIEGSSWFIEKLMNKYPYGPSTDDYSPVPLQRDQLVERLATVKPIDHKAMFNDKPLAVYNASSEDDAVY